MEELKRLRKAIEHIDHKIIILLGKRFRITHQIQDLKSQLGIALHQKEREKNLLRQYLKRAKSLRLPVILITKLFKAVFSYSRKTGIIK